MTQPTRTITVTTRRRAWLRRLTVTHPDHPAPAPGTPRYDPDRARELLTRTATMPATKHDLKIVLTEYRHALHSLLNTTQPRNALPKLKSNSSSMTRPLAEPASSTHTSKSPIPSPPAS